MPYETDLDAIETSHRITQTRDQRRHSDYIPAPMPDAEYEFRALVEQCGYCRAVELTQLGNGPEAPPEFVNEVRRALTLALSLRR